VTAAVAAFIFSIGVATMALTLHVVYAVRKGRGDVVLRAAPLAVLPLVVPQPVAIYATIATFAAIAKTGNSGRAAVYEACRALMQVQWMGLLAGAAIIAVAVVSDRFAAAHTERMTEDKPPPPWQLWLLIGLPAVILPAIVLSLFTHAIPHTIFTLATRVDAPHPAITSQEATESARMLGAKLIGGLIGGLITILIVGAASAATFLATGPKTDSKAARGATLVIVALAVVAAIAGFTGLGADMRLFHGLP